MSPRIPAIVFGTVNVYMISGKSALMPGLPQRE
jgi:hypothetical protein